MTITYELEWTWCNKPACKRCPHGPYWYSYESVGKKDGRRERVRKRYVGKFLPLTVPYSYERFKREQQICNNPPTKQRPCTRSSRRHN